MKSALPLELRSNTGIALTSLSVGTEDQGQQQHNGHYLLHFELSKQSMPILSYLSICRAFEKKRSCLTAGFNKSQILLSQQIL